MQKLGSDWLYIAAGAAVLYLVVRNSKALSGAISGAAGVTNPLLNSAATGAQIVTNPDTYSSSGISPFQYNYTGQHALDAFLKNWWDPTYLLNIPFATIKRGWT